MSETLTALTTFCEELAQADRSAAKALWRNINKIMMETEAFTSGPQNPAVFSERLIEALENLKQDVTSVQLHESFGEAVTLLVTGMWPEYVAELANDPAYDGCRDELLQTSRSTAPLFEVAALCQIELTRLTQTQYYQLWQLLRRLTV